jgi:hypothetical protein
LADVVAVVELLQQRGVSEIAEGLNDRERIQAKKKKVQFFIDYARTQGTLVETDVE